MGIFKKVNFQKNSAFSKKYEILKKKMRIFKKYDFFKHEFSKTDFKVNFQKMSGKLPLVPTVHCMFKITPSKG